MGMPRKLPQYGCLAEFAVKHRGDMGPSVCRDECIQLP